MNDYHSDPRLVNGTDELLAYLRVMSLHCKDSMVRTCSGVDIWLKIDQVTVNLTTTPRAKVNAASATASSTEEQKYNRYST